MSVETATEPVLEGAIEARTLRKFADALTATNNDARLHVGPDGLSAETIDPPHVCMTAASLPADCFGAYSAHTETVGLPAKWLRTALADLGGGSVRFEIEADTVIIGNERGELRMQTPTLSTVKELPDLERVRSKHTASVTVTGLECKRFAEAASESPNIELSAEREPESVVLRHGVSSKPPFDDWAFNPDGDPDVFDAERARDLDVGEDARAIYTTAYVETIAEAITASPPVTLAFAGDYPLMVRYPLVGVWTDDERAYVEHHLAPRIPDGDSA